MRTWYYLTAQMEDDTFGHYAVDHVHKRNLTKACEAFLSNVDGARRVVAYEVKPDTGKPDFFKPACKVNLPF